MSVCDALRGFGRGTLAKLVTSATTSVTCIITMMMSRNTILVRFMELSDMVVLAFHYMYWLIQKQTKSFTMKIAW